MGYDEFPDWENIFIGIVAFISVVVIVLVRYQVWKGNAPFAYSQPNNLIIKKGTYEVIICLMYIITPLIPDQYLYTSFENISDDDGADDDSNEIVTSTRLAAFLSFLSQFSTAASELIVLQMSQELYIAAKNPFASKKGTTNFNFSVLLPSFLISIALICFGPEVYGLTNLGFCWIQDRFTYVFFFFYLWVILLYPFSLLRIYQAKAIVKKGLKPLGKKQDLTSKSIVALWFYLIQWGIVLVLLFANMHNAPGGCFFGDWRIYCKTKIPKDVFNILRPLAALSLATRGILSFFLLWLINRKELKQRQTTLWAELFRQATRKEKSQTLLNEKLRQEILFYTSKGIRWAIRSFQEDKDDRFSFVDIRQSNESNKLSLRISSNSNASDMDLSSVSFGGIENDDFGSFSLVQASRTKLSSGLFDDLCTCVKAFNEKGPSYSYRKYVLRVDEDILNAHSQKAEFRDKMTQAVSYFGIQYFFAKPQFKNKKRSSGISSAFSSSNSMSSPKSGDEDIKLDIDKIRDTFSELNDEDFNRNDQDNHEDGLFNNIVGRRHPSVSANKKEKKIIDPTDNSRSISSKKVQEDRFSANHDLRENLLKEEAQSSSYEIEDGLNSHDVNEIQSKVSKSNADKEVGFVDYEPEIFGEIREIFGVKPHDYFQSFSEITKEKFSEGKSGAFLYYSHDEKYIVKTTTREELKNLLNIITKYRDYIRHYPHTFIVKFFSAHAVTMYDNTIYFFVMGNFFATKYSIDEYYDLKGSYIDRRANIPIVGNRGKCKFCNHYFTIGNTKGKPRDLYCYKRGMVQKHEVSVCLKDNDVMRKCIFPNNAADQVREQLKRDSTFLSSLKLMDYSLILGVHHSKFHVLQQRNEEKDETGIDMASKETDFLLSHDLKKEDSLMLIKDQEEESIEANKRKSKELHSQSKGNPYGMRNDGAVAAALIEAPSLYYIGIVDILQGWTMEKKMENIYKRLRGKDGKGISSVEPKLYCTRFQERVVDALIQGDVGEEELQSIREIQALQSILEEEKYITTLEGGERKRILDPEGILKAIWKKIRLPKKKDQDPVSAK